MYTFSLLYITIAISYVRSLFTMSVTVELQGAIGSLFLTPLFSASVVCVFYAEVFTMLAIMSTEIGTQEKKPGFSGNLILGNH